MQNFVSPGDPAARIPPASGARWWLPRWGLFALREPLTIAAGGDSLRGALRVLAIQRYGWLRKYRGAIRAWSRWESTVSGCLELVRTQGLSVGSDTELEQRDQRLESELIEFVRQQSASTRPAERLVGSTEILESVFGKRQTLARQESNSGITSLIVSLCSMLGKWTASRLRAALESPRVKAVHAWCAASIPTTVPPSIQSQRRRTCAASPP